VSHLPRPYTRETAACEEAHIRCLALALIEGNVVRWNSATDEERAEVRAMLARAGIVQPNEKLLMRLHLRKRTLEIQRLAMEAKNERRRRAKSKKATASKECSD